MCPGEQQVAVTKLQEVSRRLLAKEHIPLRLWSESYLEAMETITLMTAVCAKYQSALVEIAAENRMGCIVHNPDGTETRGQALGPYAKIALKALKDEVAL